MLAQTPYPPPQPTHPPPPTAPTTINPADSNVNNPQHPPPPHAQPPGTFQTLRLRDEPPPVTQPALPRSRKRKTPPSANAEPPHIQPAPPGPPPGMHQAPPPGMPPHGLPPPHALVPPPHLGGPPLPPGYQYHPPPGDYTPGGMPPPPPPPQEGQSPPGGSAGRPLSQSKRAEQNRKAQRAFRERRDQHVKALESRSQLLDAALASADEANRRWEECRALVDSLRIEINGLRAHVATLERENADLRNALGAAGIDSNGVVPSAGMPNQEQQRQMIENGQNGQHEGGGAGTEGEKNDS